MSGETSKTDDAPAPAGSTPAADATPGGTAPWKALARSQDPAAQPERIGPYRILGILGEGGMGIVYAAEQDSPVRRQVALKVIKLGMDTREVVARFEAERQALALLDHPGIARMYDAGATDDGRPYFAMERVHGVPLLEYCDRHKLNLKERLGLFAQVCRAVDHAHHRGIIHRDLKPSNILVSTPDERPVAKIIDFGVSKATNQRLTEKTIYTGLGRAVGTPAYMSPEQAEMTSEDVDHRSDVYSLGIVLYELLVGELPLSLDVHKIAFDEILRRIRDEDPPTPSTRWTQLNVQRTTELASKRRTSPGALRHELRGDLDWVTMKAMEKERERRYGSAAHLAEDVERFLRSEPVLAGPPGALHRIRKYVGRNRTMVVATSLVVLALTLGLVASICFAYKAAMNERMALENARLAEEQTALAKDRLAHVLRLSDVKRLAELSAEAEDLWPCVPEKAGNMERWLARAREMQSRLPDHEATLKTLREKALPYDEAARAKDRESHPDATRLKGLEEERKSTKEKIQKLKAEVGPDDKATVLSFGADPAKKPMAGYFRHAFQAQEIRSASSLKLRLVVDDGAVVYLNGAELLRVNMPEGPIGPETAASKTVQTPEEEEHEVSGACLKAGEDLLAVEVHQSNHTSSDLRLSLELLAGEKALVGKSASWSYWYGEKDPGSRWNEGGFDASGWPSGPGPLGYGFQGGLGQILELEESLKKLERQIAALDERISMHKTWSFGDAETQRQHELLAGLVQGLEGLVEPGKGLITDIEKRLEFSRSVRKRSVEDVRARWDEAVASIRDTNECPRYRGLVIAPQIGLVPIGRDPRSGLWEFAHLQTGDPPRLGDDGKPVRNAEGELVLAEETGIVLVLIPGSTFRMGAVRAGEENPEGSPNVDPDANDKEGPVHEVTLAPFFLSKYEMTQGQWLRFTGERPSAYGPGWMSGGKRHTLLHPVEQVSLEDCQKVLSRMGLVVPTEAQWEYAARAGTTTVWWTGNEKNTLQGAANLADGYAKRNGGDGDLEYEEWLDDGYTLHAPVGSFKPNAFGLHDVAGNIWEWCRDAYGGYHLPVKAGDGERQIRDAQDKLIRGGGFNYAAGCARSAFRGKVYQWIRHNSDLGIRPARVVTE